MCWGWVGSALNIVLVMLTLKISFFLSLSPSDSEYALNKVKVLNESKLSSLALS